MLGFFFILHAPRRGLGLAHAAAASTVPAAAAEADVVFVVDDVFGFVVEVDEEVLFNSNVFGGEPSIVLVLLLRRHRLAPASLVVVVVVHLGLVADDCVS